MMRYSSRKAGDSGRKGAVDRRPAPSVRKAARKWSWLVPLLVLVLAPAGMSQSLVEVQGAGVTRESAIFRGLVEALQQVNGTKLESNTAVKEFYEAVDTEEGSSETASTVTVEDVKARTDGFVRSYQILDEEELEDGTFQVKLRVAVLVYDPTNPRPGQRPTLAVLFFSQQAGGTISIPGEETGIRILEDFATLLGQEILDIGAFNLVEREYLASVMEEQDFIATDKVDPKEQAKLGQLLGADYVIQGTVSEFHIDSPSSGPQAGSQGQSKGPRQTRGRVKAAIRITSVASGQQVALRVVDREMVGRDWVDGGARDPGMYPSILLGRAVGEWREWIEANFGPVQLLCAPEKIRARGKAKWRFVLDNPSGLLAPGQVFDLWTQDYCSGGGGSFWNDQDEVCSIRVVRAEGRQAQAEIHLLEGESMEDMEPWLEEVIASMATAAPEKRRWIARRRTP